MRRIIVFVSALFVLAAAATAYAAINTYPTASFKFSSKAGGTSAKPVPIGYTQSIAASGTNGNRTAILLEIKTKIYGIKIDGADFPTCSLSKISSAHNDSSCPAKAKVATGDITAVVGPSSSLATSATPQIQCDPNLDVWNGGKGQLVFFFVDTPTHACGPLTTGDTGPWAAGYTQQGKSVVLDDKIPATVDFPIPNNVGSLITFDLNWLKVTTKVKGKTVAIESSIGCMKGKRPFSTTFVSTLSTSNTGPNETDMVTGSAPCKS